MRDLLQRIDRDLREGQEVVLGQVVETRGLDTAKSRGGGDDVDPEGGQGGDVLGGGCVEAEVKQKAIGLFGTSGAGAKVFRFVLDHDYAWADGLICGGKMVILAESLQGPLAATYFARLREIQEEGSPGTLRGVVVDPEGTRRQGRSATGGCSTTRERSSRRSSTREPVDDWPEPLVLSGRPWPGVREGVAWLPSLPRIRLVVVGAGHVGQAVASLAARADFEVWVVDDRRQYANPERLPEAARIVVGPMEEVLPRLAVDELKRPAHRYPGPRPRPGGPLPPGADPGRLRRPDRQPPEDPDDLRGPGAEQGVAPAALERVSAPIGVDIGSESVFEIAVSIVAELIAVRNLGRFPTKDASLAASVE